jgi:2-polyprenyl-3-methyl-5-hydroxy-6-metoxy-1,4-benzoquinol methylase
MTNLTTTTISGLHDFVLGEVIAPLAKPEARAVDLGAGSGVWGVRLKSLGLDVLCADKNPAGFHADLPFVQADFDAGNFSAQLGEGAFALVTAIEVIEHMESPIGFLRNIGRLLVPDGVAVLTTPNVDNMPARVKFLLTDKLRMMDEHSEVTHISPIFWDLFNRQFLPRAGLELAGHHLFPRHGYSVTRPRYAWAMRALGGLLPGECREGDNHVLILRHRRQTHSS